MQSDATKTIVLRSPNAADLTLEEVDDIAAGIRDVLANDASRGYAVSTRTDRQLGAGTRFIDVLIVMLPDPDFIKDVIYGAMIAEIARRFRRRFAKPHQAKRPRVIDVQGPDGEPLARLVISDPDAELEAVSPDPSADT